MSKPMSERSSVELAADMHELSVHLWNALGREYNPSEPQYLWMTSMYVCQTLATCARRLSQCRDY